jgi:hypothetical protein
MLDKLYQKLENLELTLQSYENAFILGDNSMGQLNRMHQNICSEYHAVQSKINELEQSAS